MKNNGTHEDRTAVVASFLTRREEDAEVAQFVALCRRSPRLRRWLCDDFARFDHVRDGFKRMLESSPSSAPADAGLLRRLAARSDPLATTKGAIHKRLRIYAGRIYGGLSWSEVEELVRHYHAGTLDTGAFWLVHDWMTASSREGVSSRLSAAAVALLDEAIRHRDKRLLRHVLKAVDFLEEFGTAQPRRAALGHVNWWKVSVLLYLLNHPKSAYRTRELRAYLASQGLDIETKDLRRFCVKHGIRRDTRAGRPVGGGR